MAFITWCEGNKGAAAISFMFNGTSFCFICCHLTSGHEKMSRFVALLLYYCALESLFDWSARTRWTFARFLVTCISYLCELLLVPRGFLTTHHQFRPSHQDENAPLSTWSGFDLAWFSSLSSDCICIFSFHGAIYVFTFFCYILCFAFQWAEPGGIGCWPGWLSIILPYSGQHMSWPVNF